MTSPTLTQITAAAGQDVPINANFQTVSPGALFARRYGSGISGLVLGYYGGTFEGNDIADGTTTLAASQVTIYVVALKSTGVVSSSTSNSNWNDTTNYFRIGIATTGPATITALLDKRQAYSAQAGSSFSGGTLVSALNEAPTVTLASAATVNIGAAAANTINVTGTTTITAFDTIAASAMRRVVFAGILTLTHNGTSLILPTAANITTAAGDVAEFVSLGSGNWRCVNYMRASGNAVAGSSFTGGTLTSALNEAPAVALASAATVNIGAAAANTVTVSGTTTITAFDTIAASAIRRVRFLGILALTHNATSLILPGSANITTAAGDVATMESLGSGNWRCINYSKADGTSVVGAGLSNWTEAVNTSTPNATVPVVSFKASNAATNVDIVLGAKGNGATATQVADNTTSGGNKRGGYAFDWQSIRSSTGQVATGSYSVLLGTNNCTANGTRAGIYNSDGSTCAGTSSAVVASDGSTCAGNNSVVAGGTSSTSAGANNATLGGQNHANSGTFSGILGGDGASSRGLRSVLAFASGSISNAGDQQRMEFIQRVATSNATPTAMAATGGVPAATTAMVLQANSSVKYRAEIVARDGSTGDTKGWIVTGTIKRRASAALTSLVGTPTVTVDGADAAAAAWTVAAVANTTLGSLELQVTGAAATVIRWTASVWLVENAG